MKRSGSIRSMAYVLGLAAGGLATFAGASSAQAHAGFDLMPYYDAINDKIIIGGVTHAIEEDPVTGQAIDPTGVHAGVASAISSFEVPAGSGNWVHSAKFISNEQHVFAYEFGDGFLPRRTNGLGVNREQGTYIDVSNGQPYSVTTIGSGNQTGFAVGNAVLLQAIGGLVVWDDALEDFVAADLSASITLADGLTVVDGGGFSNNDLYGWGVGGVGTAVGTGGFHAHHDSEISAGAAAGIYAFQVQAFLYDWDGSGLTDLNVSSDPFWLVYNYGMDDGVFDEAYHFLNGDEHDHDDDDDHHNPVPEPMTASLLALGGAVLAMRRRR